MKNYKVYITLPTYYYEEVEAMSPEEAVDNFQFMNDPHYETNLRQAARIECQELNEGGEVIDIQLVNQPNSLMEVVDSVSDTSITNMGLSVPIYYSDEAGYDIDSIKEKFDQIISKLEQLNSQIK